MINLSSKNINIDKIKDSTILKSDMELKFRNTIH